MRKKLAALLTRWAMRLNPEAAVEAVVPTYEHYEAKAIGIGREITKNDLRKFKKSSGEKSSRKALRMLIDETIKHNSANIIGTVNGLGLVEAKVYRRGESTIVESKLNVYVKKTDSETENAAETGGGESPMP